MSFNVRREGPAVLLAAVLALAVGCGKKEVETAPPTPAVPSMTGPSFLRGTIGSLVRIRDFQPLLVSGYGVVKLPDGSETGSSYVPAWLRQRLVNEMRKQGMGTARYQAEDPARFLARRDTVIVEVFGFVPPGAVPGARFDLVVKTLDEDTDATSLAGGILFTTDLAPGGANRSNLFLRPVASAYGPAYINPFDDRPDEQRQYDFRRRALIVAGGKATTARPIQLLLNQPSWTNSRLIADRINDHFSLTSDRQLVAEAQTDLLINLNVPDRFASDPTLLMELITHSYVQTGGGFEQQMTERLGQQIEQNPGNAEIARHVAYCWQAMGRAAIPVLRDKYYHAERTDLRLAALRAGAWLGDTRAGEPLAELARAADPAVRILAVESLVHLPRNIDGLGVLRDLLNDEDQSVRIAAYETLAANNDPLIGRVMVEDDHGLKYMIDRVPSDKPLIYVTPRGFPRIAIFQPNLAIEPPMLASLWGSKLMMRVDTADVPLEVYYVPAPGEKPRQLRAEPMVATLAYLMGHHPTEEQPNEGLDLTFSQVADALYTLCHDGSIDAPIEFQTSPLARLVEEIPNQLPEQRPETDADDEAAADAGATPIARPETGG